MHVEPFFDPATFTLTYLVFDEQTKDAVIIDPVLDYEPLTATISFQSINKLMAYIEAKSLIPRLILDTHCHADHMTGAFYLKQQYGCPSGIGEAFKQSQMTFGQIYNLPGHFFDGFEPYELLLKNEQILEAGTLQIKTLAVPGHTPACMAYLIKDAVFVGDAILQPDLGTGRADFPGGCAEALYHSIVDIIYQLPGHTKIYLGHDYPKVGEKERPFTTVQDSKLFNIFLHEKVSKKEFVQKRKARDQMLSSPKLLWPAMQINIMGGKLPMDHKNDRHFLRIPLTIASDIEEDFSPPKPIASQYDEQ